MNTSIQLYILGSSATALAVLRDAARLNFSVFLIDTEQGCAFDSRFGKKLCEQSDDLPKLRTLLAQPTENIRRLLLATSDKWLKFVQANRAWLVENDIEILHPDFDVIQTCLDKQLFANFCRANKLPIPVTWFIGREPRPTDLQFPVIVRPTQTNHDAAANDETAPKAIEIRNEATLQELLAKYPASSSNFVLSNSLLSRRLLQISVPFSRSNLGCEIYTACKVRPLPEQCAVGTYVMTVPNPSAEKLARTVIERLDCRGIGEVEILQDQATGENFLIELNVRPWLQYAMSIKAGYHFLAVAAGVSVPTAPHRKKKAIWVDFVSDLFGAFSSTKGIVRQGKLDLMEYAFSVIRSNSFAYFYWLDPAPAYRHIKMLVKRNVLRRLAASEK